MAFVLLNMAIRMLMIAPILGSALGGQIPGDATEIVRTFLAQSRNNGTASQACQNQLRKVVDNPMIALQMFDSSTKIPEGVLASRIYQLGDFDECVGIESQAGSETIYGKYCLGSYQTSGLGDSTQLLKSRPKERYISPQSRRLPNNNGVLQVAICIPSGCTPEEVLEMFNVSAISFDPSACYSTDTAPKLDGDAIFAITILSTVLATALASTLYDISLSYQQEKAPHPILTAFSVTSNMKKLLASSSNPNQILCLSGIKSISMMWVIIAHNYALVSLYSVIGNLAELGSWMDRTISMFIMGAMVSVDTFFVVGGLVTVYTFLQSMRRGYRFNIPIYYLHRYLRLTPVLAVIILFTAALMKYVSNGPLWFRVDQSMVGPCRDYWWSALLYIQNFIAEDTLDFCVPQSWYLSVDMQLFISSPVMLICFSKWPKYTLYGLFALTGIGIALPFVLGWEYDLIPLPLTRADLSNSHDAKSVYDFMSIFYTKTYVRFAPYVMGMILGYFVFKWKNSEIEFRLSPIQVAVWWTVAIGGMLACVFAGHTLIEHNDDKWSNSLYLALNRPAWAFCVGMVIWACVSGYGGPVDTFLSLPIFQFLNKISYSMYLVHYWLIVVIAASLRYPVTISNLNMMYMFWANFMSTLGISVVLCLLFESPVVAIEKIIFGNTKLQPKKSNNDTEINDIGGDEKKDVSKIP